jgi:signal transduction histidine kinase
MIRSGRFERRLVIALVLFSLIPTLLLVGLSTLVLREAISLQTTPAGWERLGETGRELLERAEASGDPALAESARRHREELASSIQQAQRWGYLNRRVLAVLPWLSGGLVLTLLVLGLRSARGIARELARPIRELVGWSRRVGRGEPLPPPDPLDPEEGGEFGVLRQSLRGMAHELEASRERALEAASVRASVTLARGVAHELKNALTPLRLAVHTLRSRAPAGVLEREAIEVIEAESERLDGLARAFSQFGRPPEGVASEVDLVELLDYVGRSHLPGQVEWRLVPEGEVPPVHGHYESLSRAFANLILNAVEAMGDQGGTLQVTLHANGGRQVEVRIADDGPGLPPGSESRIWEADFTTKPRGTGLGLALVRQAVHAHSGHVAASNRAAGGAEFVVVLPLNGRNARKAAAEAADALEAAAHPA